MPGRGPKIVFSALDAKAADELEPVFAAAGHIVLSNARTLRMDPLVPLLIPEVNADHLGVLPEQRRAKDGLAPSSPIPTAPRSCSRWRSRRCASSALTRVQVTTMQAVSGAGYPGVASLDILGNIVPYIGGGEEEKIETRNAEDARRGSWPGAARGHHQRAGHSRAGHRRSFDDGVDRAHAPSPVADVVAALQSFRGRPQELALPSAPIPAIVVKTEETRPQPRLDADLGGGMTVSVGRVRECPVLTHKFFALGHNTIRGAAGASILNAELMKAEGLL